MPTYHEPATEADLRGIGTLGVDVNACPLLGRGAEGNVYKAFHVDGIYAVKELAGILGDRRKLKAVVEGVRILEMIQSDTEFGAAYIARCYGLFRNAGSTSVFIKMECCDGGTLEDVIRSKSLTARELLVLTHDIIAGCTALQRASVAHRDIKPANILLQNRRAKLADFGFAKHFQGSMSADTICGTQRYAPPEYGKVDGGRYDAMRHDVYSIGRVIQELWKDGRPAGIESQLPEGALEAHREFVANCCANLPEKRWGFASVIASRLAAMCTEAVRTSQQAAPTLPKTRERAPRAACDTLLTALCPLSTACHNACCGASRPAAAPVRLNRFLPEELSTAGGGSGAPSLISLEAFPTSFAFRHGRGKAVRVPHADGQLLALDVVFTPSQWLVAAVSSRGCGSADTDPAYHLRLYDASGAVCAAEPLPPATGRAGVGQGSAVSLSTAGQFLLVERRSWEGVDLAVTDFLWELKEDPRQGGEQQDGDSPPPVTLSLFCIEDRHVSHSALAWMSPLARIFLRSNGKIARTFTEEGSVRVWTHRLSGIEPPPAAAPCGSQPAWLQALGDRLRERNRKDSQAMRGKHEEHIWAAPVSGAKLVQLSDNGEYLACVCCPTDAHPGETLRVWRYARRSDSEQLILEAPLHRLLEGTPSPPICQALSATPTSRLANPTATCLSMSQAVGQLPLICVSVSDPAAPSGGAAAVVLHLGLTADPAAQPEGDGGGVVAVATAVQNPHSPLGRLFPRLGLQLPDLWGGGGCCSVAALAGHTAQKVVYRIKPQQYATMIPGAVAERGGGPQHRLAVLDSCRAGEVVCALAFTGSDVAVLYDGPPPPTQQPPAQGEFEAALAGFDHRCLSGGGAAAALLWDTAVHHRVSFDAQGAMCLVCKPVAHRRLVGGHTLPLCGAEVAREGRCVVVASGAFRHLRVGFTAVLQSEGVAAEFEAALREAQREAGAQPAASDVHTHAAVMRLLLDGPQFSAGVPESCQVRHEAFSDVFAFLAPNPSYTPASRVV